MLMEEKKQIPVLPPQLKLLVLSKSLIGGFTKTRLQPFLTPSESVLLHGALLTDLLLAIDQATNLGLQVQLNLFYAGDSQRQFLESYQQATANLQVALGHNHHCFKELARANEVLAKATILPQPEGDLGHKITAAFDFAFNESIPSLVFGSDCPWLTGEIFVRAQQALSKNQMVIGATKDGGYYLLGLKQRHPNLFMGVRWSSASVYAQTLALAKKESLAVYELPVLADIDNKADLVALNQELIIKQQTTGFAEGFCSYLRKIGKL